MSYPDMEIICESKVLAGGMAAIECCRRREIDPSLIHVMPETRRGFMVKTLLKEPE